MGCWHHLWYEKWVGTTQLPSAIVPVTVTPSFIYNSHVVIMSKRINQWKFYQQSGGARVYRRVGGSAGAGIRATHWA
jgi:hypothetical protein